jgi:hypothetical protein
MWRIGNMLQSSAGRTSPDDEETASFSRRSPPVAVGSNGNKPDFGGGVMVCGGNGLDAHSESECPHPPIIPPLPAHRRSVNVAERYPNLPTLPARRALLNGENQFVDNSMSVGAATALMGTNFGVAESQMSPVAKIARPPSLYRLPSSHANADLLSNGKPFEGLSPDNILLDTRPLYKYLPASNERQDLSPGSSPHKSGAGDEDNEGSRPTSESFSSSSDGASDDEDDLAGGVLGASHTVGCSGEESAGASARKDFCLGIRWFIRNNKLVVGSFSRYSVADKFGMKHGDILRAVDGVEVLNMVADSNGDHPAKKLLSGVYGSKCKLHVMRVDQTQVKDMLNRDRPGAAALERQQIKLHDIHLEIPRLIAADI